MKRVGGEVVYSVEDKERKPLSKVDELHARLRPQLPSTLIKKDTWLVEHKLVLDEMYQTLISCIYNDFEPEMDITVDGRKLNTLFRDWVYQSSDNNKKKYKVTT